MASRLDRLVQLLDTGASQTVRQAAAKQIAQIATRGLRTDSGIEGEGNDVKPVIDSNGEIPSPPLESRYDWSEVISVLAKILPYLRSKNADTRNATSITISHICSLAPLWTPLHPGSSEANLPADFPPFSVESLLESNNLLLSSSGQEFSRAGMLGTPAELERARKEAKTRLGLDFLGDDDDDPENTWTQELMDEVTDIQLVRDDSSTNIKSPDSKMEASSPVSKVEDMSSPMSVDMPAIPFSRPTAPHHQESRSHDTDAQADSPGAMGDLSALSARERNRLKRKRRQEEGGGAAVISRAVPPSKIRVVEQEGRPTPKRAPSSPPSNEDEKVVIDPSKGGQVEAKEKSAYRALEAKPGHWVWAGIMKVLSVDLFNANWETRHGTALAIREIVKIQGAHAGKQYTFTAEDNVINHQKWCNDMAAKLLCVFVMDRFSDYVSDQVIAPVRESATQALAALLIHMPGPSVRCVHDILLDMIRQDFPPKAKQGGREAAYVWQVRHAGLLGLKYEVAVRQDLIQQETGRRLLREVVDASLLGLADADDDVRSAAAGCLLPICGSIVEDLEEDLPRILSVLWGCFESLKDDLSSSVSAVMDLLGSLVAFPQVMEIFGDMNRSNSLNQLAPLLFPFFRHTISNVRLAVVRTLHDFIIVKSLPGDWIDTSFLQLAFQNVLLEEKEDIRRLSLETWRLSLQRIMPNITNVQDLIPVVTFRDWIEVCTTPIGDSIDISRLFLINAFSDTVDAHNVDKNMVTQDLSLVSEDTVWQARIACAQCLAILANLLPMEAQLEYFDLPLRHYFNSPSYFHNFMGATILQEWALEYEWSSGHPLPSYLKLAEELGNKILETIIVESPSCYHETFPLLLQLCKTSNLYIDTFLQDSKLNTTDPGIPRNPSTTGDASSFTIASARLAIEWLDGLHNLFTKPKKKKDGTRIDDAKKSIRELIFTFEERKNTQDMRVSAALASTAISLKNMPPKLTPLIKGITNSLKMESNVDLQSRSAHSLAAFLHICATSTSPALKGPIDKVIKNLCVFLCQDDTHTPLFAKLLTKEKEILSFNKVIAGAISATPLRPKDEPTEVPEVAASHVMRRGGVAAFKQLSITFGSELLSHVPKVWQCISEELLKVYPPEATVEAGDNLLAAESGQNFLDTLTALRDVLPTLDPALLIRVASLFPSLLLGLQSRFSVIRQAVAKCFAVVSDIMTDSAMIFLVEHILPLIDDATLTNRQGAVELLFHVVNTLQIKALPYIIFLVVPLLGRMSDADDDIRSCATNSFATLIKMVPLEAGLPDPPGFPEQLLKKRDDERKFLSQLLDGSQVEDYEMPVTINAELRKYQREGVNWLAFLSKYQLHGILCDDMGLGKTLQTICILSSVHYERSQRKDSHLASLIICPPTLTNHWHHEIKKYANNLKPIIYAGPVKERRARLKKMKQFDVVITSYDVVRNDSAQLCSHGWLYCVLDEGHLIKNAKSKVSQAVKGIQAFHRLILSGTPIQNNVLELWSLFDFLMPGFLGNESSFNERFARPVLASKDGKAGAKGAEAAARALEALHKQVLPFLLRRMKENVLNDLPPKIIQDYYCDVSPLQQRLFDEFQSSQASAEATDSVKAGAAKGHVFQALQYLRKVCNHPALVLKDGQPETVKLLQQVSSEEEHSTSVRDIMHAPKLSALKQLLLDCGIGQPHMSLDGGAGSVEELVSAPPQHRCLIFCQMKMMIDVIENDLFQKLMPTVSYMRLDGTIDAQKRHATVQTFNDDPSIDCLLLTTHIGGLGLTLTGADTVIFVEHDWNPMKDLQAMDRAHRLGQKRVVNVYRLVTKGTLEEKIMGLQRFKLNIANSVVTQQNSGLESMDTDLVLDLFKRTTDEEDAAAAARKKQDTKEGPISQKNILNGLGELHEDDEYAEMNLESFMSSIGR